MQSGKKAKGQWGSHSAEPWEPLPWFMQSWNNFYAMLSTALWCVRPRRHVGSCWLEQHSPVAWVILSSGGCCLAYEGLQQNTVCQEIVNKDKLNRQTVRKQTIRQNMLNYYKIQCICQCWSPGLWRNLQCHYATMWQVRHGQGTIKKRKYDGQDCKLS